MSKLALTTGAVGALGARSLLVRGLQAKLRRDVARLNAGDAGPLLSGYADDAVLVFNEGEHRWSGEHRGKAAIERFLRDFTGAGLQGEIGDVWIGGPPWALTMLARFDDEARGPGGEVLYRNRVVVVVRTRWGKIVHHEDFYEDTGRIEVLERRLQDLGVAPALA